MYWIEVGFQLAVMALGYLLGAGAAFLLLRFGGLAPRLDAAALYVLSLPLATTLLSEGFTRLWRHTPGAFGLGGLTAFLPLLVTGAATLALLPVAQRLLAPFDATLPRDAESLSAWIGLAVLCSLLALGLWRFWPEPTARLW